MKHVGIRGLNRSALLFLVGFLGFIPLACDDSGGTSPSSEAIETNFGIGLASVIAAEGVPDSVLAFLSQDGVVTDTLRLDPATRSDAGVVRFPVNAPEGTKLQLVYRIYKKGDLVALGQVSWVSGESPFIPRPNLAPRIAITGRENAIVRRGHPFVLRASTSDSEKALSSLMVDWNGDGSLDDSVVPPKGRDSIRIVWNDPGRYAVAAWARDDQGLRRRDTLSVLVVPAAQVAVSMDTTVSLGDTVQVLVAMSYDDPSQSTTTRLLWNVDGDTSSSEPDQSRKLAWSALGTHRVVVAARDQAGEASRDTMVVQVVMDAPKLDLGDFPKLVDLGGVATLPVGVEQNFGSVVRWGMDFDADTARGWDTVSNGPIASVQHLFGRPGQTRILVFVQDDDGNRTVGSGTVSVSSSNSGAVLRRISGRDTTISVGDTAVVRFSRSFPEGFESLSRLEWIDGADRDTLPVGIEKRFAWKEPGSHTVAWRLISPLGSTGWDTISAQVVRDAPVLDLSALPQEAGLNSPSAFAPAAVQAFGSIVRWGLDFDGDTAKGWDTVRLGKLGSISHAFSKVDTVKVFVFVEDDDGNRVVGSRQVAVSNLGTDLLLRRSASQQRASIGDTVAIRFGENFPLGTRNLARQVWRIDTLSPDTAGIDTVRRFSWSRPGSHVVATRVMGPFGATAWDSTRIEIVLDPPTLALSANFDTVAVNDQTILTVSASQEFGRIVSWAIDFDGDTTDRWDSSGTGTMPSQFARSFPSEGAWLVLARVRDDDGNTVVSTRTVQARKGAYGLVQRSVSSDTTVSIGDLAWVRLRLGGALESQIASSRLEWRIDNARPETLAVSDARSFSWKDSGHHMVAFRAIGSFGATGWDSISIHVVQDAPLIGFADIPDPISLDDLTSLRIGVTQTFGRIVSWSIDFDGDTTSRWDSSGTGAMPTQIDRSFERGGDFVLRARVTDDDGNTTVDSVPIRVAAGPYGIVQRLVPRDTTVSIRDTARVRLRLGSVLESQFATSRIEWRVDGGASEALAVADTRSFRWDAAGDHVVRFRAIGLFGSTGWDSVRIHVVDDPPVINLSQVPSAIAVNDLTSLRISATRRFGRIVAWAVDFDGDTTSRWDTTGTGALPGQFDYCYPSIGSNVLRIRVTDDDGNTTTDSMPVAVTTGAYWILQRVGVSDTTLSVRDTARVLLRIGSVLQSQYATSRLEWKVDDAVSETLSVADVRAFRWDLPGVHVARFRALGSFGFTGWDSIVFRIVQGEPRIRSISRTGIGVGKTITFSVASDPVFGRIVRERWDFGNDGTWDDSTTIPGEITEHVFPTSVSVSIRVQVTDDDGNSDDSVFVFAARNAAPVFGTSAFTDPSIGMTIPVRLRCSFTDPDGLSDLKTLAVDWNNDGVWDTTRGVSGLASEEFVRTFATAGEKLVRLRLIDNSGATVYDTAKIVVTSDAPKLASLHTLSGGTVARIGDTLWFVAPISDPSNPADLDSATWIRDGMNDTTISLRGSSVIDMKVPVFSRNVGQHSLKVIVRDRVGNRDSASATWSVQAAAPFAMVRMSDVFLTSRDTAHLIIDSLRPGSMGGRIRSVSWAMKGSSTWSVIPAPVEGSMVSLRIPYIRDSLWYIAVKAEQDNGEVWYDTARSDILKSFIDKRDGKLYPIIEAGGLEWLGRNLAYESLLPTDSAALLTAVRSVCGNENCAENGRYYSKPYPLYDQVVPKGMAHVISVCPDGWRLPTEADFSALAADGYRRGGWTPPSMLRSRFGWTNPVTPQDDPLRFGAKPTDGYGATQNADLWMYDSDPWMETWRYQRMTLSDGLNTNGAGPSTRAPIRCVRLKEILVDSSFMRSDLTVDSSFNQTMSFKAYLPDSTAPVTVRISYKGQTSVSTIPITDFKFYSSASFVIPTPNELGRSLARYEIEQNGVVWSESQYLTAYSELRDERGSGTYYRYTRIGSQRWLRKDVDYDGVGFKMNSDWPWNKSKAYELDAMFLGSAPESGPSGPTQGICPEGYHIPSKAEWDELLAAVTADGLEPYQALRNSYIETERQTPWTYPIQPGTDAYGFDAFPSGYYDNGSWNGGSVYIAADGDGYGLMAFDGASGLPLGYSGPVPKSNFAGYAFNVRCVGD